ncbi:cation-translocating P-type ATPase [Aquabacterium sp.]|uniref:heavy metal translocating P-type ATPase n=1 Tax=Aquabacterium sp. TaxID=1872578 RepID=UPI0024898943|nr:cation-translocating P-type ATPase [Aquabacterium sp.]MDI1259107.1 cation-translocating P-type ATPase [Aquabacterium sp.]
MNTPAKSPPIQTPDAQVTVLDDEVEAAQFTRWTSLANGRRLGESSLRIGGMHCTACAATIEQALQGVTGVTEVRVSAAGQCATVSWDVERTRPSELVQAIERAGYRATPDTVADARAFRLKESRDALWRLFVASFCAMQVMMLATPSYVSASGQLEPDLKQLLDWGSWLLTLPVMIFAAAPFLSGAWRSLRNRRIGMDVPAALGMLVAFIASSGATFDPGGVFGREVYFDSLTMFISFLLGGRYLEMRARHHAERSLEDTIGRLPEIALRESPDGSVMAISVLRLKRGDIIRVPVGGAFCADGIVTQGQTRADESLLTGESAPVEKTVGDAVVAGSLNLAAPVAMRVEHVGADTRYEAIVAMMRDARTQRPASVTASDRWATPFLWSILVLAAAAAAVWSVIDPSRAIWVAVSVLIVTCPCALSLAAPSAMLSAAMAMAKQGLLLRRIEAIEGLAGMQTLFIDKTGTLTEARRQRATMIRTGPDERWTDDALRQQAASLAAWSTHPLAKVLAQETAKATGVWHGLRETPGQGIEGCASDGSIWQLGRASRAVPVAANDGHDAETWLSRDGQPVACFRFTETLRPGAMEAVRALEQDGVSVILLSGDSAERVHRVGRLLGLNDCQGGMAPQDKLTAVREAQARGQQVAMLGDGINDAPVLAQADTSIAMGEGAQIARAQADGVLVTNDLQDVVRARALAKKTLRVVRQNFIWAASYNAACVPLALMGWLPPWAAGLGMATSSLLVVLNSLRLSR